MIYESKKEANARHIKEKLDIIKIQPTKEIGARIREHAKKSGKSLQRYIIDILIKTMDEEDNEK